MLNSQEILLLIGESGSGKSTFAKDFVNKNSNYIRLNRDDLRTELVNDPTAPSGFKFERFVAQVERSRAADALKEGKSILLDNTHLNPNTVKTWENFAGNNVNFRIHRMTTSFDDCVRNDNIRVGKSHVGRAVISRQFLLSKRLPFDINRPIILVDIDGTVSNSDGIRSPYDELHVGKDKIYPVIVKWVQSLYEDHTIFFVSGRHSTCGDSTINWMNRNNIPFHHIFMRHGWDNRSDFIIKEEILNELLGMVPKDQIKFTIDDRNRVIADCWRKNGLMCIPVRGTPHHSLNCPNVGIDQKKTCEFCGAIGNF